MSKQVASNTFTEGLITDLNPLTTPNNVLTDCLNGTLITYNGKEFVLQNDMGNAVVERATLPMGYVPIGVKEYNGIVYVIAYNPLEQRVQFGSFPSPEIDFDGDDFDPEEYQLEGAVIATTDFYMLNEDYPSYTTPDPIENLDFDAAVKAVLPVEPDLTDTIWNDNNPFGIMYWEDFGRFGPDGLPNKYDAWTLETDDGELKYRILKSDVVESFESYTWLRLNAGDRFLIYHVDLIDIDHYTYVDEILRHYLSIPGQSKLFKVEVFAVSEEGSKTKLDIDPFLYKKEAVSLDILNGDIQENVKYTVFNGELNSIIEIKISLERPEKFKATFKQYTSTANAVRFKTMAAGLGFMQIKGFKYNIRRKVVNPDDPQDIPMLITGYMRYKKQALYNNFEQKTQIKSYVELRDLPYGTYDYIITPYTQFGYEYGLIAMGSFTVSALLILEEEEIIIESYSWNLDTNTNIFHLELSTSYDLIESQSVTSAYLEIYDVWSNVSKILSVTPDQAGNVLFDEDFSLDLPAKSKTFTTTDFGGIPASSTQYNELALLPSRSVSYQTNNILFTSANLQLSPNKFYVLALYYIIDDEDTGLESKKGIYRYFYTNAELNNLGLIDYSNAVYPETMLQLTKGTLTTLIPNSTESHAIANGTNSEEYLLDPLIQTFNAEYLQINTADKRPYIILPKQYFDTYYSDSLVKQKYYKHLWFKLKQEITHGISMNDNPGILNYTNDTNESAIIVNLPLSKQIILNESQRLVTNLGGSTIPDNEILGSIEPLNTQYSVNPINDDSFQFITYGFPHSLNACRGYDYIEQNISYINHLMPLYYSASEEIISKLINSSPENIHLALTSKLLSLNLYSDGYEQYFQPQPVMSININGFNYYLNTGAYCNDGGRNNFVQDCFRGYNNSFYNNLIATPANPPLPTGYQENYTLGFKNGSDQGCQFMLDKYDASPNEIIETLYGLRCTDANTLVFLALNNAETYSNLIDVLFFVGGYVARNQFSPSPIQEYKLYNTSNTKYSFEALTSKAVYDVTTNVSYTVLNRSCYRIYMPAQSTTQLTVLKNSTIKAYIENRFNFLNYDGGNLIPMLQEFSLRTISYGSNLEIPCGYVNGELEDLTETDSTNYEASHPTMSNEFLNQKYLVQTPSSGPNGVFFDRSAKQLDVLCGKLYTLSNVVSSCYHLAFSPDINQLALNNTYNLSFTGLDDYRALLYHYAEGDPALIVLRKYKLY